ncbi:uncharacterized protein LOC118602925 [Rousettus aegyptiacus]|uniref:uncharacterized protein LOC118602925 n=1 Tax=Rousettus aegyptiacus TaxID=9407 RepID=UPI00168D980B|nr:uncharacterized protein LOC118602925 [Rousettus aegyptiacus]
MPTPVPGRLPQFPATLPGPSSRPAGDRSSNPVQLRWGLGSSCQPFRSRALLWLSHVTCGPSAQPGPLSRTGVAVGMSGPRLRPRSRCFRGHAGSSGGRSTPRDRQPRAFASQGSESLLADGFSLRWPRGTAATFLRGHSPFADAEEPTRPPAWFPPPDNWESPAAPASPSEVEAAQGASGRAGQCLDSHRSLEPRLLPPEERRPSSTSTSTIRSLPRRHRVLLLLAAHQCWSPGDPALTGHTDVLVARGPSSDGAHGRAGRPGTQL